MLAPLSPANQPALILKYAREAVALAGQHHYAALETDRTFQLALAHLIELTAEAAQKTQRNQAFWDQYPQFDDSRERLRAVRRQIAHFSSLWTMGKSDAPPPNCCPRLSA